jgi:hypothetical protein
MMQPEKKLVKLIARKKAAALIEFQNDNGETIRLSVPSHRVTELDNGNAEVILSVIKSGIPYGIPWGLKISDILVKGSDIEREMHNVGIWTADDLKKNPQVLQGVIMAAASELVRAVSIVIKEYSSKEV